jgi:hypothetical protein
MRAERFTDVDDLRAHLVALRLLHP